jgi:hypothetical protein
MSETATKSEVAVAQPPKPPLVGGMRVSAIVPQDFEGAYRLATVIFKAKMAPKSLDSVEKITVAIMHGMEVGFTPMAALQSIAVVNGMPAIWGDGMLALVESSGLLEDKEEHCEIDAKGEPSLAVCRVKRVGRDRWYEQTFTQAEAIRAGLWNKQGPWQQYRRRMMIWRVRGWALRDAFPDVLRGLRSAEEALDMVDITPRPAEPTREQFRIPRDVPATDIEDTNQPAAAAETTGRADTGSQGAAGDPPHDAETGEITGTAAEQEIVFEKYVTFSSFAEFSDAFLQAATTTEEMAREWEAFYRDDLAKYAKSKDQRIQEGAADLIGLYSKAILPKDAE